MIRLDDVSFSYDKKIQVLSDIKLNIDKGEKVGLIGANGAGKSTLLKALLGLIDAGGEIEVADLKLNRANLQNIRKKTGIVLQDSDNQMFMPTVLEDMIFGPVNYGMSYEDAKKRAMEVLNKLGMKELGDKHNHRLSGGEKKVAAIATILTMEPEIILMDEPSASLDPYNRRKLIELINDLQMTMLIATHDLDLVLDTCSRVLLMYKGKIVSDGAVDDILGNRELLEKYRLELPLSIKSRYGRHDE